MPEPETTPEETPASSESESPEERSKRQEAERERLRHWLEEHWGTEEGKGACPMCGTNSWTLGDAAELRAYEEGVLHIGGRVYPVMPVVCVNCGNTVLINAILAGVLQPDTEPESDTEAKSDTESVAKPETSDEPDNT
jgi:hypothetical protein